MPAARLTAVGAPPPFGTFAPRFRTLIIRPHLRDRMPGITRRHKRTAEKSFKSRSSCHISSLTSRKSPRWDVPALLTKTSTWPNAACVLAMTFSHSSELRMSADRAITLPLVPVTAPWASISAFAAVRTSLRLATMETLAPEVRKLLAIALPIPALPPVIRALRPSSRASIIYPRLLQNHY